MEFNSIDDIKSAGFVGFVSVSDLFLDTSAIPNERGNYLVLYLDGNPPNFLINGAGGFFKGKNPNVPFDELESNWIKDAIVIYIGQAGGIRANKWSTQTLRKRINKYMKFGQGRNKGHYGGRLIWQLENYKNLVLCWKEWPNKIHDPKMIESKLISEFKTIYGKRPFANLQD